MSFVNSNAKNILRFKIKKRALCTSCTKTHFFFVYFAVAKHFKMIKRSKKATRVRGSYALSKYT